MSLAKNTTTVGNQNYLDHVRNELQAFSVTEKELEIKLLEANGNVLVMLPHIVFGRENDVIFAKILSFEAYHLELIEKGLRLLNEQINADLDALFKSDNTGRHVTEGDPK